MQSPRSSTSIAVIIAAKNAAKTVRVALRSALDQAEVTEVILVDDASTDATASVARDAADGDTRLHIVTLPVNLGPAAARNRALEFTNADLVCILDADDYMLPGRMTAMLANFSGCDILADDLLFRLSNETKIWERGILDCKPGETRMLSLEEFVRRNMPEPKRPRGEMGFLKPLMSRAFLKRAGLRYREGLRLGEDYALYAEALRLGARFKLMDAAGYVSVERDDSLSSTHTEHDLFALQEFDRDFLKNDLSRPERSAVLDHYWDTRGRLALRRLLAAKSEGRYLDAFGVFMEAWNTSTYIVSEISRAYWLRAVRWTRRPSHDAQVRP